MKKLLLITFLFIGMSYTAFCQCYLSFKVVDALGNADTVTIRAKDGATENLDEHLEEVNLFGTEPKDLDLRIIRRTDINYSYNNINYWLYCDCKEDYDRHRNIFVKTLESNLDFKVDYRPYINDNTQFALKVYAKNYPVTIYALKPLEPNLSSFCWIDNTIQYSFFNEEGKWIDTIILDNNHGSYGDPFVYPDFLERNDVSLVTFENEEENLIVALNIYVNGSIDEDKKLNLIYPNPSKEYLIIENGKEGEKFEIVDLEGKLIQTFIIESYPYSLDISKLSIGTYFLKNAERINIYKFIKE